MDDFRWRAGKIHQVPMAHLCCLEEPLLILKFTITLFYVYKLPFLCRTPTNCSCIYPMPQRIQTILVFQRFSAACK